MGAHTWKAPIINELMPAFLTEIELLLTTLSVLHDFVALTEFASHSSSFGPARESLIGFELYAISRGSDSHIIRSPDWAEVRASDPVHYSSLVGVFYSSITTTFTERPANFLRP